MNVNFFSTPCSICVNPSNEARTLNLFVAICGVVGRNIRE
jgi:hypothetical protein